MAKKKHVASSTSELIRVKLKEQPELTPSEMAKLLVLEYPDLAGKEATIQSTTSAIKSKAAKAAGISPKGSSKRSGGDGELDRLKAQVSAFKLVNKLGGIDKVKTALGKLANDPLAAVINSAGGIEKAKALIESLDQEED